MSGKIFFPMWVLLTGLWLCLALKIMWLAMAGWL